MQARLPLKFAMVGAVVVTLASIGYWERRQGFGDPFSKLKTHSEEAPPVAAAPIQVEAPPAPPQTANLEDFTVLSEDEATGEYEFQLDGRVQWQELPGITVSAGDVLEFSAEGHICAVGVGCVGPNGKDGPAGRSLTRPEEFPVGGANFQALVAKVGPSTFQVGAQRKFTVPAGGEQGVAVMSNFRIPELGQASGGFKVKVKITRNKGENTSLLPAKPLSAKEPTGGWTRDELGEMLRKAPDLRKRK